MYVADASDGKVYSYNMPDAIDARLASLTLSGVDIGEFSPSREEYEGVIAEGVTETTVVAATVQSGTDVAIDPPDADAEADGQQVALEGLAEITVEATAAQSGAGVVIDPPDADGDDANGHQVGLAGVEEITVTVTSADGSREKTCRVALADAEATPEPWAHCLRPAQAASGRCARTCVRPGAWCTRCNPSPSSGRHSRGARQTSPRTRDDGRNDGPCSRAAHRAGVCRAGRPDRSVLPRPMVGAGRPGVSRDRPPPSERSPCVDAAGIPAPP